MGAGGPRAVPLGPYRPELLLGPEDVLALLEARVPLPGVEPGQPEVVRHVDVAREVVDLALEVHDIGREAWAHAQDLRPSFQAARAHAAEMLEESGDLRLRGRDG
eukprot:15483704-Alexandrium_andersonii.AAC.1